VANRLLESKENSKDKEDSSVLSVLGQIVSAYVRNHTVEPSSLSQIIQQVFSSLIQLQNAPHARSASTPAVEIDKSITPEYLICLEDGRKLKMLKRHLRTSYGLTPEQYRERWDLPIDYPMVAPNYARKRSSLAKSNGLGHGKGRSYTASANQRASMIAS
jgi:predicted transcriptional regulator